MARRKPTPIKPSNPVLESVERAARLVAAATGARSVQTMEPPAPRPIPAGGGEWSATLAGPRVTQSPSEMYQEVLGGQGLAGGILTATHRPMTIWYHEDGTTSLLPMAEDWYYGRKPGFHPAVNGQPPDWWQEKQKNVMRCPVSACGDPIRVVSEVDNAALEALGFKSVGGEDEVRNAVLLHVKLYHPMTYNMMRRNGDVTNEMDRNLK